MLLERRGDREEIVFAVSRTERLSKEHEEIIEEYREKNYVMMEPKSKAALYELNIIIF